MLKARLSGSTGTTNFDPMFMLSIANSIVSQASLHPYATPGYNELPTDCLLSNRIKMFLEEQFGMGSLKVPPKTELATHVCDRSCIRCMNTMLRV